METRVNPSAYIIDTETTDKDKPEVIEFAVLPVTVTPVADVKVTLSAGVPTATRYGHSGPMKWGAVATHHILPNEVATLPPFRGAVFAAGTKYIIGHNVDFDWRAIGEPDVKRICTLALARDRWPDLDSHTQSALMYFLAHDQRELEYTRDQLRSAHSAAADVMFCFRILSAITAHMHGVWTWEDLWSLSEAARTPKVCPFGKHKGTPMDAVPHSYRQWYAQQNNPPPDPYVLKAWGMGPLVPKPPAPARAPLVAGKVGF